MMKEAPIEQRLRTKLEGYGFKVLKLTTPGYTGPPDRMILPPKWAPGAPWYIELKAPKKHEARKQQLVREDWRARGLQVLDMADTFEAVDARIEYLMGIAKDRSAA